MSQRRAIGSILAGLASILAGVAASPQATAGDGIAIPPPLNTDYAGQLQQANIAMDGTPGSVQAYQQARAAQVLRRLDINNPASVDWAVSELVKAGALEQANAIQQMAQQQANKVALWRTAGTLAGHGRCADARTLALQSGDYALVGRVASVCSEILTPPSTPGH